ncbi:AAA family ATPase [Actinomadura rubrisoli]|uniref:DNA-binding protein n=1 Tax=Actinomadura rubrisoli TaxID=2530368 RepID=A0A4R5BEL3_9ACTN|nr:AAA family ATPase [Actinomadura rubrisoli]TDD82052.1 DNA-binding protein [Actinomadura rubrisoli]
MEEDGNGAACPYQGLAPFKIDGSELFFGRARATRGLLERLGPRLEGRGSILLVSGASGVGKSSLLRAGLMPALAEGEPPVAGARGWTRLLVTPTSSPLRALAEAWADTCGGRAEAVEEQLRDDPHRALSGPFAPDGRLALVVDQFEELFTLVAAEQERQEFARVLHGLAEGPEGAGVVIGLRADYWDRCAAYPQFAEAIQDGQVIVEPMAEEDLRLAITGPAAVAGLEIEPGLVDILLDELRAGREAGARYEAGDLPLLSQALRNTWERREKGRLTIRGYEESGRVRDSVRRTADDVLERLPSQDRRTALRIFRRMTLITEGGRLARRKATLAEIRAAASADSAERRSRVDALLSAFAGRRLLTLHEDAAEISHDALLTEWPALRQWLEPDLVAQQAYDRLVEDAGQWDEHNRDSAFLYRGARLLSVQDSRPRWDRDPETFPPPGPVVEGFVAASAREARRAGRRRALALTGLAMLSATALVAAGIAIVAADDADRQRGVAVSRQLAAQSEIAGDPVTSSLLAVAAWRTAHTPEARHRLLNAAADPGRGSLKGHRSFVRSVEFSPDGKIIATSGSDGIARLWDTASRAQLGAPIVLSPTRTASEGHIAFSPDGRVLASAFLSEIRFWDVSTHRELGALPDIREVVKAIAFAPDGKTLAVANLKGTVQLWDVAARRPHGDAMGRAATGSALTPINDVAFSPDGRRLATASWDRTARLWDTATQKQAGASLTGHTDDVMDVAFSPDGTSLATAGMDGTARLWDAATHRQIGRTMRDPSGSPDLYGVAFNPDGTRLATAGSNGAFRLWATADQREVGGSLSANRYPLQRVRFSPDGRLVAIAGDDGVVRLGDPVVFRQIGGAMPGGTAVALSPDGKTLAAGGADGSDPAIHLWDVATQHRLGAPLEPADRPRGGRNVSAIEIRFGRDGRTLVAESSHGARVWDVASRRQIGTPLHTAERGRPDDIAISPGGGFLAVESDDSVRFWKVAERREVAGPPVRIPHEASVISAMALSPDGASLATAGFDRKVRVFDVATRRQIGAPLPFTTYGFVDVLAFSPDGGTLAATADDDTVRLWDVARRGPVGSPLSGHTGQVAAIAFSPDGRTLATGGGDDAVRLWDLATQRQIGPALTGHKRTVTGIAFGRDGSTVATVGEDGTARLWNVALPADPVAAVCAGAGRSFTRDEWKRYVPQEKYRRVCP